MSYYLLYDRLTNAAGDGLANYRVRLLLNGVVQTIYSDTGGTPIQVVSGYENAAKVDDRGNFAIYAAPGIYALQYLDPNGQAVGQRTDVALGLVGVNPDEIAAVAAIANDLAGLPALIDQAQDAATAASGFADTSETYALASQAAATTAAGSATNANASKNATQDIYDATVAALAGQSVTSPIVLPVASLAALASLTIPPGGTLAEMHATGRKGRFVFVSGNQSAAVTADPLQGVTVAPSSAPSGASGIWQRIIGPSMVYEAEWFGLTPAIANAQNYINAALKAAPAYATVMLPAYEMLVARTTDTSINAGSSGLYSGRIGAIYIDKEGQRLEGRGFASYVNGQGAALNCIMVRASHTRVSNIRAGNCSGQLNTNESAAFAFQPSNFVQGTGTGVNITGCTMTSIWASDCDSGITAHPESDQSFAGTPIYLPSNLTIDKYIATNIRRQGVEAFMCDGVKASNYDIALGDKGAYQVCRGFRIIGSREYAIEQGTVRGGPLQEAGNDYIGVELSHAGWYGNYNTVRSTGDGSVIGASFHGLRIGVDVAQAHGSNLISNCRMVNTENQNGTWFVRLWSIYFRSDPPLTADFNDMMISGTITVEGCDAFGMNTFAGVRGSAARISITNNRFVSADLTTAAFVIYDQQISPSTLFRTPLVEIIGNTGIMPDNVSASGVNRFTGGNSSTDLVIFADNRFTADSSGAIITDGSTMLIRIPAPDSNEILPATLFDDVTALFVASAQDLV